MKYLGHAHLFQRGWGPRVLGRMHSQTHVKLENFPTVV